MTASRPAEGGRERLVAVGAAPAGSRSRARRLRRAALDGHGRPAVPGRALYALGAGRWPCSGSLRPRCSTAAAGAASAGRRPWSARGGAGRRRRRRRAAARPLGRAGVRRRRGIESVAGARMPYQGLDADLGSSSRSAAPCSSRSPRSLAFWPRRGRLGFPGVALTRWSRCTRCPPWRSSSRTSSCAAPRWPCSCSRSSGSSGCGSGEPATPACRRRHGGRRAHARAGAGPRRAVVGLREWALGAAPRARPRSAGTTTTAPLDWPRDGRELLRVRAASARPTGRPTTSTASTASAGSRTTRAARTRPAGERARDRAGHAGHRGHDPQSLEPGVVTAGYADTLDAPTIRETPRGDGTWVAGRPLRRGDAYSAVVYTPATNESQRRRAGAEVPATRPRAVPQPAAAGLGDALPERLAAVRHPLPGLRRRLLAAARDSARDNRRLRPSGSRRLSRAVGPSGARGSSPSSSARRRDAGGPRPVRHATSARLRLHRDAAHAAYNLEGFLFDAKRGYCQQFSGAMALLLRMAGVPARVVDRLHLRLARHARRASTWCATSTPTRGWRSGTATSAG